MCIRDRSSSSVLPSPTIISTNKNTNLNLHDSTSSDMMDSSPLKQPSAHEEHSTKELPGPSTDEGTDDNVNELVIHFPTN